jgi:hypothetical protein
MSLESESQRAFNQLREQAKLQMKINESTQSYLSMIQKIGKGQANIRAIEKSILELREKASDVNNENSDADELALKLAEAKLKLLKDQNKTYIEAVKNANKERMAAEGIFKLTAIAFNTLRDTWGKIKSSGLFEMSKAVKTTALSMGLVNAQTKDLSKSIFDSTVGVDKMGESTLNLGVGMQDIAKMQADYSEQIGRSVTFTEAGSRAMAQLAKGTMLGSEGAAAMVASMDAIGKGAASTRDYIQSAVQEARSSGVNSSVVIKNIRENISLLNKYNFKEGAKGLKDMAMSAAKMQTSMELVAPMAEKLFNIEGAVEMSAQLQVLGGRWAALADPFKLMYMARNDMNALNTSIIEAVKSTATFNKETKEFDIAPLDMQRLRAVAQATGLDFEQLAKSAKNAAKFSHIDAQIKLNNVDKKTQEYIEGISSLDENGNATIHVQGQVGDKLVSALTKTDMQAIQNAVKQKETLAQQAKNAQNFDDALANTLDLFKTAMLPIIENLNNVLVPFVRKIFDSPEFKQDLVSLGKNVGNFLGGVAGVIKSLASIAFTLGPGGTLATIIGGSLLFNAVKWYGNGVSLGEGFLTVAKAGMAGSGSGMFGSLKSGLGKRLGLGVGLGAAGFGVQALTDNFTDKGSTANKAGNILSSGLNGAAMGSMILPGWGTGIGAALGLIYGAVKANQEDDTAVIGPAAGDAIFNGKDKSNYTKNRGIIENGRITPIDNKDELIAAKPNGVFDTAVKSAASSSMDVNFGEITINGSIVLKSDSNSNGVDITGDLLKNSEFIRNITKMVHVETSKALNGGKISGQPSF